VRILEAGRDKTSPVACLMLHLRSRYVSKAAILRCRCFSHWSKIEVPLEFQGLGPLQRRFVAMAFSLAFDSLKERACGS
jgi:hypothetical protein